MAVVGEETPKEAIKVVCGHKDEALIWQECVPVKKTLQRLHSLSFPLSLQAHTQERPCEDITRRWLSASQKKKPHQKPTLLDLDTGLLTSRAVRK